LNSIYLCDYSEFLWLLHPSRLHRLTHWAERVKALSPAELPPGAHLLPPAGTHVVGDGVPADLPDRLVKPHVFAVLTDDQSEFPLEIDLGAGFLLANLGDTDGLSIFNEGIGILHKDQHVLKGLIRTAHLLRMVQVVLAHTEDGRREGR